MTSSSSHPIDAALVERLRLLELEEARIIQQSMVITETLREPDFEVSVLFRPAAAVGGDFLDYFRIKDGRLGFYVGDVVGKGLAAAMYAALAVGTLRGINKHGAEPPAVLELLNERLRMRIVPGRFCAVLYGLYEPATRDLVFANAALPRPLLVNGSECRELGDGGLPSGMFGDARYDLYHERLAPGDFVLFMTDGLPETENPAGEQMGEELLADFCARHAEGSAERMIEEVLQRIEHYAQGRAQHDDMTAMVLHVF